jgi:beta-lactamase class A
MERGRLAHRRVNARPDHHPLVLDALRAVPFASWSAAIVEDSVVLDEVDAEAVLPTASIGKLFLLLVVAEQLGDGRLDAAERLAPAPGDDVADSGVLQFFTDQRQTVADLALLVGATSDNLATNVLVRRVGLDAVHNLTSRLGVTGCALHDMVRDVRVPGEHPPHLSTGNARELVGLAARLAVGTLVSAPVSARVRAWLAVDTDLSMVAAAFGLDPLAHATEDLGVRLWNKTGTNLGTRADVGTVTVGERSVSYAVIARWSDDDATRRAAVLAAMRAAGAAIDRRLRPD